MKILVLGGTGAIGKYLIPLLSDRGYNITVTSRKSHDNFDNVSFVQGNAHDDVFIKTLLKEEWDVIIDFMVYNVPEFEGRITELLQSTKQYIYFSSARVYEIKDDRIDENDKRLLDVVDDSSFLSTNDYSLRKARTEDVLLGSRYRNYTIIRPYITFDENRLQLGAMEKERWLKRTLQGKSIVLFDGFLSKKTTLTYGGDVANAVSFVVGNASCLGEIYNVCTEQTVTWQEVLDIYADRIRIKTGKTIKLVLTNSIKELLYQRCFYSYKYDRFNNRVFSNKKIKALDSSISFSDTKSKLIECIDSFLERPKFGNTRVFNTAEDDRLSQEYTNLKDIHGIGEKMKYLAFRFLPKPLIALIYNN